MEKRTQTKKRYHSASYLNSGAVFYGTLMFAVARLFTLFQLFSDAASRKRLDQAPPENFTFLGILWLLVVIGIIGLAFYLQVQSRQKRLRMKQGNYFLLLNTLLALWGIISAISYLVEMIIFFEFVYLLDFLTLIGALVIPSVLYQLADRNQDIPQDNLLFFTSIGATVLSSLAALIVALVLRKSYTAFQLLRELMFRAGIILFGVAGLLKAIRLRAELPELVASMPKREPKVAEETPFNPMQAFAQTFAPKAAPKTASKSKVDAKGRIKCPDCGKKLPQDTRICPHCGYYPGDPLELAEIEAERQKILNESSAAETPASFMPPEPKQDPKCEKCGKKIPGGLSTCPYCGYHPDDDRLPKEPPKPAVEKLFEDVEDPDTIFCPRCDNEVLADTEICPHCGYPFVASRRTGRIVKPTVRLARVPDPKRLTEKNSIECPECGRRYSAARDRCPYCGYGLYDD